MSHHEEDYFEHRTIGPPGCGKTTWLTEQVRRACDAGRNPMIVSLTKAAANEVVGRDLPVMRHQVGTLHSQCHYALGRPTIAEDKQNIKSWNEQYPHYRITPTESGSRQDVDRDPMEMVGDNIGDDVMNMYQIMRARMTPKDKYPPHVQDFAARWEDWKTETGHMDFTDLIERALQEVEEAPGSPDVIFIDEGQDMNVLEMALARKWGQASGMLVTVGDPDQNIYSWRGSDPNAFMFPEIPDGNWRILSQSHRVPRAVHGKAVPWITNCRNRRPVQYKPTAAEGEVRLLQANWEKTDRIVQDMEQYLQAGRDVMLIASCSYMLRDMTLKLRLAGIPFHNPQRRNNGAWNPLHRRDGQVSASDRLLAFLKITETGDLWDADCVRRFCDALKLTGVIQGNRKQARLDELQNDDPNGMDGAMLSWETIHNTFTEEAVEAGLRGDVEWFLDNAKSASKGPLQFPAQVIKQRGPEELRKEPSVTVGTVHSVKGGEASAVYLFPDLSAAGMREFSGPTEQRNTVYRLFYVGMTRAKDTLVICQPGNGMNYAPIL